MFPSLQRENSLPGRWALAAPRWPWEGPPRSQGLCGQSRGQVRESGPAGKPPEGRGSPGHLPRTRRPGETSPTPGGAPARREQRAPSRPRWALCRGWQGGQEVAIWGSGVSVQLTAMPRSSWSLPPLGPRFPGRNPVTSAAQTPLGTPLQPCHLHDTWAGGRAGHQVHRRPPRSSSCEASDILAAAAPNDVTLSRWPRAAVTNATDWGPERRGMQWLAVWTVTRSLRSKCPQLVPSKGVSERCFASLLALVALGIPWLVGT